MNDEQRRALEELRFDWAVAPDDVWERSPFHVDQLHDRTMRAVLAGIDDARTGGGASPIGLVIEGQRGAGKTHMLGWVRERVAYRGGYFFLIGLYEADSFWDSVALGVVEGLQRVAGGTAPQLVQLLTRLAHRAGLSADERDAVTGAGPLGTGALDALVTGVRGVDQRVGQQTQDTLRALTLYASADADESDLGYDHLLSVGAMEPDERRRWGIRHPPKPAQLLLRDISYLLALTGPTVMAVDQIDTLVAESRHRLQDVGPDEDGGMVLDQLADALMTMRQVTRRTLSLVACLPETWERIKVRAEATVADRFREASQLQAIPSADVGRALVEKRFGARFRRIGFAPPHPTWPVSADAFVDVVDFTPRALLQRIDRHVERCLADDEARDLVDLDDGVGDLVTPPHPVGPPRSALRGLDQRFAELRREADVADALDPSAEDEVVPRALSAGLTAWIGELGEAGRSAFAVDPLPGRKPGLHARLKQTLDENSEHEAHWSFRAIGSTHGNAALSRLKAARMSAGLQAGAAGRRLVLLRNDDWSKGTKTQDELTALRALGAEEHRLTEEDLRTFFAVEALLRERPDHLQVWLATRRPASSTKLLGDVLGHVAEHYVDVEGTRAAEPGPGRASERDAVGAELPAAGPGDADDRGPAGPGAGPPAGDVHPDLVTDTLQGADAVLEPVDGPPTLLVGLASDTGEPVHLGLESLRRHTAIFAGSGSGKTVLIRRLVEDCARQGVSAIVLDPNNDLARLGDPWPTEPSGWLPGDTARATDYFDGTEVVVWTPGRESGNPLSFQPLPDFEAVLDDQDEFDAAIDATVSTLAPQARVDGKTAKATLGRAVLKEALRYFAEAGRGGLDGFIEVLSSLPLGVSGIKDANRIGRDLGQLLTAAMVNDPLFGGAGAAADPGMLLTPSPGRRARVSVVNFVGLPADEQRQGFVNQLQMALFAWVKAHPAGDRPLGGLFVMDEAQTLAPSGEMTACTKSTLTLASQARKYGLGLLFATQAPKGLHNRIPGNAFSQFFGYLNSPSQIAAANEMARAKGSRVPDISRVDTGEFFVSGEGVAFQRTRVPLCLTHHPASPLTTEEVLDRARRSAASLGRGPDGDGVGGAPS